MSDYRKKTYRDSFLYNANGFNIGQGPTNAMRKHDTALLNFIMKSERIDKDSEAFSGINEDIKRQQTSAILYQILKMPNVHLCIGQTELPPAFKVFEAYDIKRDRKPAIFIDVTRLIELRGPYFVCKDLGKFVTYLFGAMTYIVYSQDITRVMNNSDLTISGTECYVGMFNYILDYMRIIGYSVNKEKISYLIALFYLNNMLGKELDTYTKNIAAKTAKLPNAYVSAMDMFIEDGIFNNIDDFVTFIAETFRLKGFTTEVFISKWIYLYGNGSQYATELFTSFSVLVSNAFCGAYVSNQKQIERVCGQSMVRFCNALIRVAADVIDRRQYMEASELDAMKPKDKAVQEFAKDIKLANEVTVEPISKYEFGDGNALRDRLRSIIGFYTETHHEDKIQRLAGISEGIKALEEVCADGDSSDIEYQIGCIPMIVEITQPYRNNDVRVQMERVFNQKISQFRESMEDASEAGDDRSAQRWSQALTEISNAKLCI